MEVLCRWGFVEVEIAAEDLVGTLAREHHFDSHRLDDASQQVHGRRSTHGGDIVGFDEIDDVADGIKTFLNGIVDFVVNGADMVGYNLGFGEVGSTLQSYGKRVQTWPIGFGSGVVLNTHLTVFLGDG